MSVGVPSLDEINANLERAGRELSRHLDAWDEAHTKEVETKSALQDLLAAMNDDPKAFSDDRDLEYKYYKEIPKFGRAARDAGRLPIVQRNRDRVLHRLPTGAGLG